MRKYHPALVDAAQYCKALDKLEKSKHLKQDIEEFPYILDKNPQRNIFHIKRDTDICICSIEKDRIVFAFQGSGSIFTRDIKDWINNTRAMKKESSEKYEDEVHEVGIHKGLYKTWKKFEKEILSICSEHGDSKAIYIHGHSRGGGLTILASFYIAIKLGFTVNCPVMGSLMVGDDRFRDLYRQLPIYCTEIIIKRDLVPKLPGKRLLKYKHVGHIYYLENEWWYYLPIPFLGVKIHVDYYNNILKRS